MALLPGPPGEGPWRACLIPGPCGVRASFEPRHGEVPAAGTSFGSQAQQGGRRLESQPTGTSQRYDLAHFHPGQAAPPTRSLQSGGYLRACADQRLLRTVTRFLARCRAERRFRAAVTRMSLAWPRRPDRPAMSGTRDDGLQVALVHPRARSPPMRKTRPAQPSPGKPRPQASTRRLGGTAPPPGRCRPADPGRPQSAWATLTGQWQVGPHPASRGSRLRGVRAAGPHPRVLQGPTCPSIPPRPARQRQGPKPWIAKTCGR